LNDAEAYARAYANDLFHECIVLIPGTNLPLQAHLKAGNFRNSLLSLGMDNSLRKIGSSSFRNGL